MSKKSRYASFERTTSETSVRVEFGLEGTGSGNINTTIPFVDHMLNLLAKHGLFDLTVEAKGDTEIDHHHTVEDIGMVLGLGHLQHLCPGHNLSRPFPHQAALQQVRTAGGR